MILYLLGGYLRKNVFYYTRSRVLDFAFFGAVILTIMSSWIFQQINGLFGTPNLSGVFSSSLSVTTLVEGVMLLLLFSRIKLESFWLCIVKVLLPLSFSVYLIHDHELKRGFFIRKCLKWISEASSGLMLLYLFSCVFGEFILCCVIDPFRHFVFSILKLNNIVIRLVLLIEKKICSFNNLIKKRIT